MKTKADKARAIRAVKRALGAEYARLGGFSLPAKMPGFAIGILASRCKTGSKLAKVKGSVCHGCYALKGNYRFTGVQAAQARRLAAINAPTWVSDMTATIKLACNELGEHFFRFHDSGDVQNLRHLLSIVQIAKNLPTVSFWLPTKELWILKVLKHIAVPSNLTVRISAFMTDKSFNVGLPSSSVSTRTAWVSRSILPRPGAKLCSAYHQSGYCSDCRACWSRGVKEVTYPAH
jgi:hypothetical protein